MVIRKSRQELEKMRRAGLIVGETLTALRQMVAPGVTTQDLDSEAERRIRAAGATPTFKGYHGYPASICASVNDEVVHGIPSGRKLQDGDLIKIDCGATLDGYVGDAAISVLVGRVSPEVQALVKATQESLFRAMEKMRVGNRLFDVSYAVQEYVEERGYSVVREYCGHGVGRRMHEEPQVPNYGRPGTGPVLKEGWVLAIEPMVNLGRHQVKVDSDGWTVRTRDGSFSSHWEHTIAVTENGPVVLTAREDGTIDL
ncbi:MAG: type I methionyl aminopeptidase [Acidobacteria bacterium]|nr:type I methionyl aminopeptidase [Acidobacteriota bacterium]MCW5968375.1 type I methionyl aminopeptidase [Blastocatellales bacterium]